MTTDIVDPSELMRALLDAQWNASNCSKPQINLMVDATRGNAPYGDSIRIYNLGSVENVRGLGHNYTDVYQTVTVQIEAPPTNTDAGRVQFWKLVNETRRIIHTSRKTPGSNYHELNIVRHQDLTNKHTGKYKYIFDVELKRYVEAC
jgi:hypothetical protein